MIETTRTYLKQWAKTTEPRIRLQHTYIAAAISSIVIAGVVGLFDVSAGRALAGLAAAAMTIFAVNAITWALLQSVTASYFSDRRTTKK